jgi:hypothetical protein
MLPRLTGADHGLVHRLYLLLGDFHRAMALAQDQAAELRGRRGAPTGRVERGL